MDMTYFNAEQTRDNLVAWIKDWFYRNGPSCKAVIGISGGKDSTVVAALCARALGTDRVLGVLMPNGTQTDIQDSYKVCEKLGIASIVVNIQDAYAGVYGSVLKGLNYPALSEQTTINIRWGDECGDMKPLVQLTKSEVVAVGLTMDEIPRELVEKTPSDGLTGMSDEEKIGFTYDQLDTYIRTGDEGAIPQDIADKIKAKIAASAFKLVPPEFFYRNGMTTNK